MKHFPTKVISLLPLLGLMSGIYGQTITGIIVGSVSDPSGLAVVNAASAISYS